MKAKKTERRSLHSLPARRFAYPTQAVFLSQAALLEEVGPPKIPALACFLGFALVGIAIITSMLVKIDVVSTSTGRLVSSTANQSLQSFDGGIVDKIYVEEGQIVNPDDLLLTLRDPEAEAQLARLQARHTSLAAQAKRLHRLAGIAPLQQAIVPAKTAMLASQQMAILPLDEAAIASERSLVRAEISRHMKALANLHAVRGNASARLNLANEKLATQGLLHQRNLIPKPALYEAEREAAEAHLNVVEIEGQITKTEATILESNRRLTDVIAARRQRQGDQLSSIMVDLSEVQQQILSTKSRLERATFRAPTRGVIQELNASFSGQLVTPGDKLLELIAIDGDLIVDTRLPTTEIRHVMKGQKVRVSVDGIEPHRVGYLEGNVERLSPSTFVDENGLPYYRARIALNSNELAGARLIPGMTVEAQIQTDQRTILEYLLKPVYRAWNTAFRER